MIGRLLRELGGVVSIAALTVVLGLMAWTLLPGAAGWRPTVVLTGSMAPAIRPGDVVVSGPVSTTDVLPGRVLLMTDPGDEGRLLLHRAIAVNADRTLTTRGDANPSADSAHVALTSVVGLPRLRIPVVGLPVVWLREGRWPMLVGAVLGLALVVRGAVGAVAAPAGPGHGRRRAVTPARAGRRRLA